ncbi:hypothetical protein D3C72_2041370 [compost metagenome]
MLPEAATLFVKFNTCAAVNSVKLTPSVEVYTRSELFRLPVELFTTAQLKLRLPALTPVKLTRKSMARAELLSVAPVPSS